MATALITKVSGFGGSIDPLTPAALTVELPANQLGAGMVVVDDLGCPCAILLAKRRAPYRSGDVVFDIFDLDRGWHEAEAFRAHEHRLVRVVAR